MESFKVICKGTGWERVPRLTKIVTAHKFFGLIKHSRIVDDRMDVPGPVKDEICIVTETYISRGDTYYVLKGYPYGGYDSRYFIRLDEFTENQKQIAEKADFIAS